MEQGFGNFRYGGEAQGSLTYRAYGMGFTRGPEYHPDGRNFDDWRARQGGFRMDWGEDDSSAFIVEGDIYDQKVGERVQAVTYAPPYEQIVDGNAFLSDGNINIRWRRRIRDGGDIQVQGYYDRTNRYEPNLAERRNTYSLDSLPQQRTDNLFTAFFQDEIGLVDNRLSFIAGTKLIHSSSTGINFQPGAHLLWLPSDQQTICAAYTNAIRTPSEAEENFFLSEFASITSSGLPLMGRFKYKRPICSGAAQQLRIKVACEWRPLCGWRLRGTDSYLYINVYKSPDSGDVGTAAGLVGASPQHKATIRSFFEILEALQLVLTYRYVSQLPAQFISAYSTGDVRIASRFAPRLEFSMVDRNLLQPYHPEYAGDPNAHRHSKKHIRDVDWGG